VIQPLLDTLRRDAADGTLTNENLLEDLETLHQYVGTSLRIFRGLLSFATGSVEGVQLLQVDECLDTVLSLLARSIKAQHIQVSKEIPDGLPRIPARRQDIEQLFLNLLTNARESMSAGGRITIRLWTEEDEGGRDLRITVTDTGRGIPSDVLGRVFEPFFTTKSGGTGIGLDICRSIVWEYDGVLWLESDVGKGTVAHVRLPYGEATASSSGGTG
jgi:two-component system NtrC family sensor kinase